MELSWLCNWDVQQLVILISRVPIRLLIPQLGYEIAVEDIPSVGSEVNSWKATGCHPSLNGV